MKVRLPDDPDKFIRVVGKGPDSFSVCEDSESATVIPKNFQVVLINTALKQKLFSVIFELLENGKEVTVDFGSPTTQTNYFVAELVASDTTDYFKSEYGILIEVNKNKEDSLASAAIFKKIEENQIYEDNLLDDFNTSSFCKSFFEENYLGTCDGADFGKDNVTVRAGDYNWIAILHSPFMQVVQHKKILNIPQNNTPNSVKYDPNGLFIYLNEERNEIEIILNGEKNIEDELLQNTAIVPLVVHALKNNYSVALNFGFEDSSQLNYQVHQSELFESIDQSYRVEACSNLSVRVEEREEVGNMFTCVVLTPA